MIRKLILSAALAIGAVVGVANTASAQPAAHDDHDHRVRFEVLVRHLLHWDSRGVYRDRDDAMRAARRLGRQGFEVRVQRVGGR